ncbi:hypothetical protein BRADI_1g47223v3 [Brachypodium distachyon]|uniref:Uncharacterized protein n=1 Tax=Brachypodium distachyon TaxID=15368 RepID=A0A2K2DPZ6_BRADI|nr:hypothetical protein BRADI_1g47223v3 [Brachypodium distachyon]
MCRRSFLEDNIHDGVSVATSSGISLLLLRRSNLHSADPCLVWLNPCPKAAPARETTIYSVERCRAWFD